MASIKKRGEHTYLVTVSNGYDISGKKLTEHTTIHMDPTLPPKKYASELTRIADEFENRVKNGTYLDGAKITFAEFADKWIRDYAEKNLEKKTVYRYKDLLTSRILPAIGHIKLDRFQPTQLISFYNNLSEKGIRRDSKYIAKPQLKEIVSSKRLTINALAQSADISKLTAGNALRGKIITAKSAQKISKALNVKFKSVFEVYGEIKALSTSTIHHHHTLISAILRDAVEWQIIEASPADRVPVPKVGKSIPKHYTQEQTAALIEALKDEPIKYRTMIILDAFTGLRTGEFMGLDWDDVNLETKTISINKVSQYICGLGTFTKDKPKNDHSIRILSLPPFVVSLLKEYRLWWEENKQLCEGVWQGSNRLFVTWDGRPLYTYALLNWMPEFLKRHNLPHISPHSLRHTFASLLAKKIPIPELAKLLGHGKPSTTSDIYVHFLKEENSIAPTLLEDMLIQKNDKEPKKQE